MNKRLLLLTSSLAIQCSLALSMDRPTTPSTPQRTQKHLVVMTPEEMYTRYSPQRVSPAEKTVQFLPSNSPHSACKVSNVTIAPIKWDAQGFTSDIDADSDSEIEEIIVIPPHSVIKARPIAHPPYMPARTVENPRTRRQIRKARHIEREKARQRRIQQKYYGKKHTKFNPHQRVWLTNN